jgi:hypothetical protein
LSSRHKKKYMLTEQLEAMLPRRRRKKLNTMGQQRKRNGGGDESDSDRSIVLVSEDEEEPLTRRRGRHTGQRSAATKRVVGTGGKKRRAPEELPMPTVTSKRNAAKVSNSKGKERDEDKSGWSPSQWAAIEERIKYFQQVDDFELEVEPS